MKLIVLAVEMIDQRLTLSSQLTICVKTVKDAFSGPALVHQQQSSDVYLDPDYRRKISFEFY